MSTERQLAYDETLAYLDFQAKLRDLQEKFEASLVPDEVKARLANAWSEVFEAREVVLRYTKNKVAVSRLRHTLHMIDDVMLEFERLVPTA